MKKIGVIMGSVREGRVGELITNHYLALAKKHNNAQFDLIDLKDVNLPFLNEPYPAAYNNYQYQHTKDWSKTVSGYDAFIIITPEYNHGYPAVLKNALDYLYVEWKDKPVAITGYGYSTGGGRATTALRPVLHNLGLKPLWTEVLVNLGIYIKDNQFVTSELLDTQINNQVELLIKTLGE